MMKKSLHLLMLSALVPMALAFIGSSPALAQQAAAKWRPRVESIIVRAGPPKAWQLALTASHLGTAFLVSASIPVPYSDLDLSKEPDAAEMGRRIQVAARLVCQQLDLKYPPTQYPIVEGYSGFECARMAANDGMEHMNLILANWH